MSQLLVERVCTKVYDKTLIDDISFTIDRGEVVALVGHNGAGKSTLIKTIVGTMEKFEGKIVIADEFDQDESFLEYKKHLSYIPEEPMLLSELTVMQHFQLYGLSYEIEEQELKEKLKRLVTGFQLEDKLNEYPEALSKGMRQKVQAICALLPDVPLILIDEPFMGLDIYSVDFLEQLMLEKKEAGTAILLTTHQLERVKRMADEFVLLDNGKIVSTGQIDQFTTITRGSEE